MQSDYSIEFHVLPDFGKLTKLLHLVFQEIPILSTEATMILSC